MELDVTHMVEDCNAMPTLSGSVAELGQDASKLTWRNSIEYAKANPLLADDNARDEARVWLRDFGAWSAEEIAAWNDAELNALVVQFIAGDIREMVHYHSESEFRDACESGRASGRLYRGDNGRWFFYLGN